MARAPGWPRAPANVRLYVWGCVRELNWAHINGTVTVQDQVRRTQRVPSGVKYGESMRQRRVSVGYLLAYMVAGVRVYKLAFNVGECLEHTRNFGILGKEEPLK